MDVISLIGQILELLSWLISNDNKYQWVFYSRKLLLNGEALLEITLPVSHLISAYLRRSGTDTVYV